VILQRTEYRSDGIFGELYNEENLRLCYTLEHSFPNTRGGFLAKIPPGSYTCTRGLHRLKGMDHDFESFEITGVPNHTGLLFHTGNFNSDSEGCILVAWQIHKVPGGTQYLSQSKEAFDNFMKEYSNDKEFKLQVRA